MQRTTLYDKDELPGERFEHTIPWLDDDFVVIGEAKLVYTKTSTDYLIHWPGGSSEFLSVLRRRGVAVRMPRVMRSGDHAPSKPRVSQ